MFGLNLCISYVSNHIRQKLGANVYFKVHTTALLSWWKNAIGIVRICIQFCISLGYYNDDNVLIKHSITTFVSFIYLYWAFNLQCVNPEDSFELKWQGCSFSPTERFWAKSSNQKAFVDFIQSIPDFHWWWEQLTF